MAKQTTTIISKYIKNMSKILSLMIQFDENGRGMKENDGEDVEACFRSENLPKDAWKRLGQDPSSYTKQKDQNCPLMQLLGRVVFLL